MQSLSVHLGPRSYPICIGSGLIARPELFESHVRARSVLVVTNEVVAPLYLDRLRGALKGRRVAELVLPDGERHKNLATLEKVFDALVQARLHRDDAILALGGGVIGDIAGFAAACYQRGIAYAQVPTTLLAQVDSAVGGKTGINHPGGKNLIGAFHQPVCVISDTSTLQTLPERHLRAGLAEVIKYGLIDDAAFLAWLEDAMDRLLARDTEVLDQAVRRSCEIKARIVAADEREQGARALLNLGHTFGHAIETATGYGDWLHGEAVAAGIVMAASLSVRLGNLPAADFERIRALVRRAGLPVEPPHLGAGRAAALMSLDKKVQAGRLRLVLLRGIGTGYVTDEYDMGALQQTMSEYFGD